MTLDLNELERLQKAATPWPWTTDGEGVVYTTSRSITCVIKPNGVRDEANAAYIAAACNAVPEMIARIRALDRTCAALQKEIDEREQEPVVPLPDFVGFDVNGKIVFEYEPSEENKAMARRVAEATMKREAAP